MILTVRRAVGWLRLYRAATRQRALEANADNRPCCALVWWQVGQDMTAALKHLTRHTKEN